MRIYMDLILYKAKDPRPVMNLTTYMYIIDFAVNIYFVDNNALISLLVQGKIPLKM